MLGNPKLPPAQVHFAGGLLRMLRCIVSLKCKASFCLRENKCREQLVWRANGLSDAGFSLGKILSLELDWAYGLLLGIQEGSCRRLLAFRLALLTP